MKTTTLLLAIMWLWLGPNAIPSTARTWIVAQDGTGDFSSVAAACEAASAGDSILIRPGAYREEGHDDPMDPEIVVTEKPLSILGDGPAEAVSLQMKFGFVDCQGVVLSNLRLHDVRGAITIAEGSYLIKSCYFENNDARYPGGGAVFSYTGVGGMLVIEDSVFKRNQYTEEHGVAGEGGGAVYVTSRLTMRRCIFRMNHALTRGGAVFAIDNVLIEDCLFLGNSSPHGAAVALGGDGIITRSTFHRNDCLGEVGGAIAILGDHLGFIPDHCIIAETVGAGIECPMTASALCCDLWANQLDPDPECGFDAQDGNFSEDPLFCDPEGGDFGLLENSPCLPGNHGGYECGRIGAGAEYCGIIRTSETTWGQVKMLWR